MASRFGILLGVRPSPTSWPTLAASIVGAALCCVALAWAVPQQPVSPGNPAEKVVQTTVNSASPGTHSSPLPPQQTSGASTPPVPRTGLNIVVLDPAHGGTDQGARGTEGISESDEVLQFATATKRALEAQGFQVILTREGNDNPSFDDRSARANAQRGAVFITMHIASTGLTGTARVYVEPDAPQANNITGLIPWDRAQAPFLLSLIHI